MSFRYDFEFPPEYVITILCNAQIKKGSAISSKGEITVLCPYTGKEFEVNLAKGGAWKCFRDCPNCPVNGGGILDFYRLYHNCSSNKEALAEIRGNISPNERRDFASIKSEMIAKAPKTLPTLDSAALNRAYSAFLDELTLSKMHHQDLLNRGFSEDDIKAVGFKTIPQVGLKSIVAVLIQNGVELDGVPGFYRENKEVKMNIYGSGFFIPYRNEKGEIVALQIRRDIEIKDSMTKEQVKEAKTKRYRWLTSSGYENGACATNVPFYGIPGKEHKKDVAYVTEGGLKASAAQSISNGWFTAIPGVTCYAALKTLLEYFKANGVTTIVDAFDSDRASNESVNNAISKIHEIAREYGFEMKNWDWGTKQKGVDDYLLAKKKAREQYESLRPVFPVSFFE